MISVIIPCYRCTETIERALRSITEQTLRPDEVFLIEDCSNDDNKTLNLLLELQKKYLSFFSITILQTEKNSGPASARNLGLKRVKSEYIAFLDSDDSWHPEKLEIQLNIMQQFPALMISGHILEIRESETPVTTISFKNKFKNSIKFISKSRILLGNPFSTPTVMLKKSSDYYFLENHRFAEDYFLWMKVILSTNKGIKISLPLAYSYKNHFGEAGLSQNLFEMEKGEIQTYCEIYKIGLINLVTLTVLIPYSFVKYLKRLLQTRLRSLIR